jgi:NADH-quinone oxidoreductase subunit D
MTAEQLQAIDRVMVQTRGPVEMLTKAVVDDPVLHARLKGVGVLSLQDARAYGAVGPTARGSGLDVDVRRDDPYGAYDRLDWKVITDTAGDVFAKAKVRLLETLESIKMTRQAVRDIPGGPIDARVEDIPAGEAVGHVEAPRGETFHYVRADGSNYPARHKVRAPSYVNVPTFKASCIGGEIADVALTLASVDPCYSCTERMCAAVDASSGRRMYDFAQLVRLSQEKTRRLRRQA